MDRFKTSFKSLRTTWNEPRETAHRYFCPMCRAERRLKEPREPWASRYLLQIGLTSTVMALAAWPWWQAKGLMLFFPVWIVFEVIFRVRKRAALICDHCGFDPFLYLTDVSRAREAVKSHLEQRKLALENQAIATGVIPPGAPAPGGASGPSESTSQT